MEGPAASSRRLGRIKHALVCEWNLFKIDHLSPIQREAVPTIFTRSADRGILDISPDIHDFALRRTRTLQGAASVLSPSTLALFEFASALITPLAGS